MEYNRGEGPSQLDLYVAGFPAQTLPQDLHSYFSAFGRILRVTFSLKKPAGLQGDTARSDIRYCLIKPADLATQQRILEHQHLLNGRWLICRPYLTGPELLSTNVKHNKRRVILKHVSSLLRESMLLYLMELHFGKVERMFAYKSETWQPAEINRRFYTYSVMFSRPKDAKKLVDEQFLIIPGLPTIYVEKYKHRAARTSSENSANVFHKFGHPTHSPPIRYAVPHDSIGEVVYGREIDSIPARDDFKTPLSVSAPAGTNEGNGQPLPVAYRNVVFRSLKNRSLNDAELPEYFKFVQWLSEAASNCKPASKPYKAMRSYIYDYQRHFEGDSNLRWTIRMP